MDDFEDRVDRFGRVTPGFKAPAKGSKAHEDFQDELDALAREFGMPVPPREKD